MKKFFLLIVIAFVTSCSKNDDNPSVNSNLILLKKSILYQSPGNIFTMNYIYNGNKIVSKTTSNYSNTNTQKNTFFYTDNLITKIESGDSYLALAVVEFFTYDNAQRLNQKITLQYDGSQIGFKEEYQYNTDGNIIYSKYKGDLNSQTQFLETGKFFLGNNNELIKIEQYLNDGIQTFTFLYDTKNSIFKNVLNLNKISFGVNNFNTISLTKVFNNNVLRVDSNQYTYNSSYFPITNTISTTFNNLTFTSNEQYFYE